MSTTLLALLALFGCRNFTTVDEACPKRTPGARKLSQHDKANAAAVQRVNCYRRLATLPKGRVDADLTAAVTDHTNYLAANDETQTLTLDGLIPEDPSNVGYTGATPDERYANHGFDFDSSSNGIWLVFDFGEPARLSGPDIVDDYMHSPYLREAFLQPAWQAAGVSESKASDNLAWWEMDIVYDYPAAQHVGRPIVYPKDEQIKVPLDVITSIADDVWDPQVYGYPITVTVGSDDATGAFTDPNPYGLFAVSHRLIGPSGEVELFVREPFYDPSFTIIYLPAEPLEPNGTYYFKATIQWAAGSKDIDTWFETGDVSVVEEWTRARRAPPTWRHLRPGTPEIEAFHAARVGSPGIR